MKSSRRLRWLACVLLPAAALAGGPSSAVASAAPARGPLIRIAGSETSSTNWSGYVSTKGGFSSVSASWVQPGATCTSENTWSAFWIGLDGDGSATVEQTGTEADCVSGKASYGAWYEMYPAAPVIFSNPVKPGDRFTGSVRASGTTFVLTLSDTTRGWTRTETKKSTTALRHSAEVIAEAPCCTAYGGILPLTDFRTVSFSDTEANGHPLGNFDPVELRMDTVTGKTKAQPSTLVDGERFTDTWHHH